MTLINKFKERVISNERQFDLVEGRKILHFVKREVGKATYIFGGSSFDNEFALGTELSIQAILSDGNIYIMDTFMFYPLKEEDFPDNVFSFDDKLEELNSIIENDLFPKYYSGITIRILTEDEKNNAIIQVRRIVLINDSTIPEPEEKEVLNMGIVAKILCGVFTIEEYANEYFDKNKESYIKRKSINNELKKLVELKHNLNEWEVEMSDSLKELEARTVLVEFNYNGEIGAEKVEKDMLIRILYNRDYFSPYNFVNGKRGEELLRKLNAGKWKDHENGTLECKHICSIKYGKKIIYFKDVN